MTEIRGRACLNKRPALDVECTFDLQLLYTFHRICHGGTGSWNLIPNLNFLVPNLPSLRFPILLDALTGAETQDRGCLRPATAVGATLTGIIVGEIGSGMTGRCLNETIGLAPLHVCLT
jgi:hypothetical protein